jgi:D-glycero-D-manno-heptose 1,7-bisphosphate phosphatase
MQRAVFIDRDGVINRAIVRDGKPYAPASMSELDILPGTHEALQRLRAAGLLSIVVTNQPDVGAGKQPRQAVEQMHRYMEQALPLDGIKVCYHTDAAGCDCRKPRPGMLLEAARDQSIDLTRSFMVGDRWRDVEAGRAAGCRTLFIDYGYAEPRPASPDYVVDSLGHAAEIIVCLVEKEKGGRSLV